MFTHDAFPQHGLSRTDAAALVRRYWVLVLTVFLAGTLGMYVSLAVFFTELYESRTQLLVKVGRENVETPATVQHGQVISQGVRVADINSEVQLLSSRFLMEVVVDRLGPDAFKSVLVPPQNRWQYPKYYLKRGAREVKRVYKEFLILANLQKRLSPREDAIISVGNGVKVEPVRDSDILVLTVRMPTSKMCVDVSNILVEAYLERRTAVRQTQAGSEFFEARLAEASKRLSDSQSARAEVRERYRIISAEEQKSIRLKQLASIETELIQNGAEIAKLTRQKELMASRIATMPDLNRKEQVETSNPSIQSLKDRLAALRADHARVASGYLPDSAVLKKVESEIADLEAAINRETPTILNSVTSENNPLKRDFGVGVEQQSVQISGLENRNQFLRGPAARLAEEVRDLTRGGDEVEMVEREYRRAEQDYLFYSKRLEEVRMSEELDNRRTANIVIAAPPETPIEPVRPLKLFLMGIAMAVSLLLGVAVSALLETMEDRILDERSVLGVGDIVFLGTVDIVEEGMSRPRLRRRSLVGSGLRFR